MSTEEASQAASALASSRWNKPKYRTKAARKQVGEFLRSKRSPDHQSKAAKALNKKLTVKQKHDRAMKGVEARRLNRLKKGT